MEKKIYAGKNIYTGIAEEIGGILSEQVP